MLNTCAELFVKDLESKNLDFDCGTNSDGGSIVKFPYQGKVAKLFFSGDDGHYFSLYIVYEQVPEEKTTDVIIACNEFNMQYKWATAYVDSDNDLIFHNDAILSVDGCAEEAFELLVRILKLIDKEKPKFMRAIYA